MSSNKITLHCPKCRKRFQTSAAEASAKHKGPMTCANCGAAVDQDELVTAAGKTLGQLAADKLQAALKGVKGFKPR